jgi:hypothetical protein
MVSGVGGVWHLLALRRTWQGGVLRHDWFPCLHVFTRVVFLAIVLRNSCGLYSEKHWAVEPAVYWHRDVV